MLDTFFSTAADSPINSTDDKANEVKAEHLEFENNDNDRKKNGIVEARENKNFDLCFSFVCKVKNRRFFKKKKKKIVTFFFAERSS